MVRGGGLGKCKQHLDPISCGQKFGLECQKQVQRKEKQLWAIKKPKLDNARKSRGMYFIHPDHKEYKETFIKALRKVELPMDAAIPCKLKT